MKRFVLGTILAALALPCSLFAQIPSYTNTAQAGVSFFTSATATATQVSGARRLPTFSGAGTLTITESGVTGSPSGCTIKLAYQSNNATVATATVSTTSFTPSTGVQQFTVSPSVASGDSYIATYACSSAYPTAGLITASFSPVNSAAASVVTSITNPVGVNQVNTAGTTDPCQNPAVLKSSASISVSSATTTQLVALSAGKSVYVCDVTLSLVGTSPSASLVSGTGSACATPVATLTGAMVASATVGVIHLGYGGTVVTAGSGDELCLTSGGTVTTETGVVTYVQQ